MAIMNPFTHPFFNGKNLDDWLSPILVKELRQGMRARVFVVSFLLLQVFLVVLVLGNVAARDDSGTLDVQNHFFWIIIGFALLVMMPMRGLVAVSLEIKNRTMETIMLTRLTAWRVVFGKWSALFAQSLLLVSAVLPYIVLRYFIGGDDVVSDFEWILFMLWFSGILIAASIAVSALGNPVVRIVILVGIIFVIASGAGDLLPRGISPGKPWEIMGWLLILGFFIPAVLFELTASGIAPVSENHAIRRRLLALLFFIASWGLETVSGSGFQAGVVIPLLVLIGICYFELAEKPRLVPRMIQTLAAKGWWGRIAGVFLLPGWPSALLFSLVVIPLAMIVCYQFVPPDTRTPWVLPIFAVLGSLLTPILVCHLFWPKMNQVLLMVVLYNVVLTALTSILEGFATLTHFHVDEILAFLPSMPVILIAQNADTQWVSDSAAWYLVGNSIVLVLVIIALLSGSRVYFRELNALFRSANSLKSSTEIAESAPAAS
jgi:hypothetical protein